MPPRNREIIPAIHIRVERKRRAAQLLESLRAGGVNVLEIAVLDLNGDLRTRTVAATKALSLLEEGVPLDGYSIGYAPIEDSDMLALPDLESTWLYTAGEQKRAMVMADLYRDGKPLPWYPRAYLRRLAAEAPLSFTMGVELEFYALVDGKPGDRGTYMSTYPIDALDTLKAEFMELMAGNGVDVPLTHHEVGPGQHEFLTPPFDPLRLADFIAFFKKAVRSFFHSHGVTVTFMPKPFPGLPGNGMHLHISAQRDGEEVFAGDPLSEEGLWFLGGLLKWARRISVYTNPTVNSYKRLVAGAEAPVYLVWGRGNRSAYVRIPSARGRTYRLELRAPDSSGNPYLLLAAVLHAGLSGLRERVDPGEEYRLDAYKHGQGLERLPTSLMEAVEEAERAPLFPGELTSRYLELKKAEWKGYLEYLDENSVTDDPNVVTDWERNMYLYR